MNTVLVQNALGFNNDLWYQERINNGFDWCKNYLIKYQKYHGLDINKDILEALKSLTQANK